PRVTAADRASPLRVASPTRSKPRPNGAREALVDDRVVGALPFDLDLVDANADGRITEPALARSHRAPPRLRLPEHPEARERREGLAGLFVEARVERHHGAYAC